MPAAAVAARARVVEDAAALVRRREAPTAEGRTRSAGAPIAAARAVEKARRLEEAAEAEAEAASRERERACAARLLVGAFDWWR